MSWAYFWLTFYHQKVNLGCGMAACWGFTLKSWQKVSGKYQAGAESMAWDFGERGSVFPLFSPTSTPFASFRPQGYFVVSIFLGWWVSNQESVHRSAIIKKAQTAGWPTRRWFGTIQVLSCTLLAREGAQEILFGEGWDRTHTPKSHMVVSPSI